MKKNKIEFYNINDIEKLLNTQEHLVYVDNGIDEVVIRYKDIPDFIVDYNDKFGQTDLRFYEYGCEDLTPIITTFGMFLNKCNSEVREDIIERLIYLQQGGEIKKYKIINEFDLEKVLQEKSFGELKPIL